MTHTEFFLERFSRIYPFSHCLWRIPEAAAEASFGPLPSPMLDLGCGDGIYLTHFLERIGKPEQVIGLDPQASEIAKAKTTGVYTQTIVGYSNKIPLPDASVASVFSNSVVEHIQDKEGTIKEVARLLKPGGVYLFSAPTNTFLLEPNAGWIIKLANKIFIHIWLQSLDQWKSDLEKQGLRIKAYRYTLTPKNAEEWKKYLLPSFVQHVPMKTFGWLPFKGWSETALRKRMEQLSESSDLQGGGNIVILAEKPMV